MSSVYSQHYHDQRLLMISLPLSPPTHGHYTPLAQDNTITALSSPASSSTSSPSPYYTSTDSHRYSMGQRPPLPAISNSNSPHVPLFSSSMMMTNDAYSRHPSPPQVGRPHQCTLCPRAFSRKHDLQRHSRVHTGAKPYPCPACRKAFARTDALKRHLRIEDTCRLSPEIQALKSAGKRRYRNL